MYMLCIKILYAFLISFRDTEVNFRDDDVTEQRRLKLSFGKGI